MPKLDAKRRLISKLLNAASGGRQSPNEQIRIKIRITLETWRIQRQRIPNLNLYVLGEYVSGIGNAYQTGFENYLRYGFQS